MRRFAWTVLFVLGAGLPDDVGTPGESAPAFRHLLVEADVAQFDPWKTLKHEGLYTTDPNETWRGIDRKHHPGWTGWILIDNSKENGLLPQRVARELAADARLNGLVEDFYRERFWLPEYERIEDQELSLKLFDLAVNAGPHQAHKLLQRAVLAAGTPIKDDGVLGPVTLAAVNEARPDTLLAALRSEAAGFYRVLAAKDAGRERFLTGWLKRAYDSED